MNTQITPEDKPELTKREKRALRANSIKARRRRKRIITVLLILVILAIAALPVYQMVIVPYQAKATYEYCKTCYGFSGTTLPEGYNEDMGGLYDMNSDLGGWLMISGADVNLPVVVPNQHDRVYYTSHLFDGTENNFGTPYFTGEAPTEDPGSVAVIHGGEKLMGSLAAYRNLAFYKNAPLLFFDGLKKASIYKIFAISDLSDDDSLITNSVLDHSVNYIARRLADISYVETGVTVNGNDRLLIIVCDTPQGKLAIAGRAVRADEEYTVDTSAAVCHTKGYPINVVEPTPTDVTASQPNDSEPKKNETEGQ